MNMRPADDDVCAHVAAAALPCSPANSAATHSHYIGDRSLEGSRGGVSSKGETPWLLRFHWYTRLLEALVEARMRQVEREIARYRSLVPHDEAKAGGYRVSYANDEELPFVR
jgi:hypothetical protein